MFFSSVFVLSRSAIKYIYLSVSRAFIKGQNIVITCSVCNGILVEEESEDSERLCETFD